MRLPVPPLPHYDAHDEGLEFFKTGDQYEGDLTYNYKDYLCKGITADDDGETVTYNNIYEDNAIASFRSLWAAINGDRSWEANPWVWALTFMVHHCNVDDLLKQRAA